MVKFNVKTLALVGCGSMGGAMLRGWLQSASDLQSIFVINRSGNYPENIPQDQRIKVLKDVKELREIDLDLLLFAIKPKVLHKVIKEYSRLDLKAKTLVSTVVAGVSCDFYQEAFPQNPILRVMPNTPVAINQGVLGLLAGHNLVSPFKEGAEAFFKHLGQTLWVQSDDNLDRLTAISGCGPGFFYRFAESLRRGAISLGFSHEEATQIALATIIGSAQYLEASKRSAESMWKEVASPGGMTQEGLDILDEHIDELLRLTVKAAYARGLEMRTEGSRGSSEY